MTLLLSIILASSIFFTFRWLARKRDGLPLPLGPKGLPFLGIVSNKPKGDILQYHHWLQNKDLYGPISSVTILGQTLIIIIHDPDIAFELLSDLSSVQPSHPGQIFGGET